MSAILVDDSHLPLVVVTYPEVVTIQELRVAFARFEVLSKRHARVAYLVDLTALDVGRSAAELRRSLGELFAQSQPTLAPVTLCEARVVSSGMLRAGLQAFDAVAKGKWPVATFATRAEANAWIDREMAQRPA